MRTWLEWDGIAVVVLVIALAAIELVAFTI